MQYSLVGTVFVLLLARISSYSFPPKVVQLKDVLDHKYAPKYFNGTWISDDSFSYINELSLFIYNVTSRLSSVKFSNITLIYRHSFEAQYKVFNLETKDVSDLDGSNFLQLVQWSPVGHDLIFVKDNNLYQAYDDFRSINALTRDGIKRVLFNGVADWVYEEEVFSSTKTLWFSPDGSILAYMKFNDARVHNMSYIHYGEPGSKTYLYPDVVTMRYPKAGTPNPIAELHVLHLDGFNTFDVFPEKFTFDGEAVLTDVVWTVQNELVVTWTNRVQNHANTFRCELKFADSVAQCKLILDVSEDHGWVDLMPPLVSRTDPSRFLQILPLVQQDGHYYPQLVLISSSGQEPLTQGLISVTGVLGWDQSKDVVFYQAVRAWYSSESHVYMVQISTGKSYCLSCNYQKPCSYASAQFSKSFTYYTLICKGPGVPYAQVHYTYALRPSSPLLIWEDNQLLRQELEDYDLPNTQDIDVPLGNGFLALVRLHLPKRIDRSGRLKYPMLLNVYGGPGSNIISDRFSIDFHTYLVSKRHVIVVHIDARGSAYRSKEQEHSVYRNLGRYEIADQIAVVKYLTERFQFIDKTKVGIWGWSYGGFATAMVLATDTQNVFKCGVSVAPVTNFLYYDSIYTERYMGLPEMSDNEVGYNWTDVTRKVGNFVNKTFLLMHGTADDNVHYQQSMMLAKALEAADIFFYQQSYPDQAHSLTSYIHHVYHTMNHFWTDCFGLYPGTV
ncbi:hypothetical protein M8J76_010559 [Diaphorina citri]|nr:hypothetical protein M8J76_010559 [Diaphorina citri]